MYFNFSNGHLNALNAGFLLCERTFSTFSRVQRGVDKLAGFDQGQQWQDRQNVWPKPRNW